MVYRRFFRRLIPRKRVEREMSVDEAKRIVAKSLLRQQKIDAIILTIIIVLILIILALLGKVRYG